MNGCRSSWSCFSSSYIMAWSKRVAIEKWTLYDSWIQSDPKLSLEGASWEKVCSTPSIPPTYCGRATLCACVCSYFVMRVCDLCRAGWLCVTFVGRWVKTERRGGMLWLPWCSALRRKRDTFVLTHSHPPTHTHTIDCGAVKPQHNDPQLLVCRKLLSAGQNKVLTLYACGSRTLLQPPGFICIIQSL